MRLASSGAARAKVTGAWLVMTVQRMGRPMAGIVPFRHLDAFYAMLAQSTRPRQNCGGFVKHLFSNALWGIFDWVLNFPALSCRAKQAICSSNKKKWIIVQGPATVSRDWNLSAASNQRDAIKNALKTKGRARPSFDV